MTYNELFKPDPLHFIHSALGYSEEGNGEGKGKQRTYLGHSSRAAALEKRHYLIKPTVNLYG